MLAVDTNVLVRLLIADDPVQHRRARQLFERQEVWIAKTVLLETEWVLRRGYSFPKDEVIALLGRMAGLERVRLEDPKAIALALEWAGDGMDFAHALHLASASEAGGFVTFDEKLVRRAPAGAAKLVPGRKA